QLPFDDQVFRFLVVHIKGSDHPRLKQRKVKPKVKLAGTLPGKVGISDAVGAYAVSTGAAKVVEDPGACSSQCGVGVHYLITGESVAHAHLEFIQEACIREERFLRNAPPDCSGREDRKSTRLNSSHVKISYAVFCLKKKT